MQKEQIEDDTLKGWWSLAKREKGGFFVKDGLLYHAEKILGQSFSQFCRKLELKYLNLLMILLADTLEKNVHVNEYVCHLRGLL